MGLFVLEQRVRGLRVLRLVVLEEDGQLYDRAFLIMEGESVIGVLLLALNEIGTECDR